MYEEGTMYEAFYGLTKTPFNITPDPEFLYLSKKHEGALAHLLYGIERQRGLIVLTGEVGTGKTTLLNTVMQRLDEKTRTAFLIHSQISPLDIYKYILYEFGLNIDVSGKTEGDLLIALKDFLHTCARNRENCVLIVDEAQNLSPEVLEEIRLLLNFETYDKKLIQIILVGHLQLHDKLNLLESAKLKQRISVVYNLLPLDYTETKEYIERRLSVAGARQPIFTDDAIAEVYRCSQGIPRLINVVCDAALVIGYGNSQRTIEQAEIREVGQMLYIPTPDASTAYRMEPEQEPEITMPTVSPATAAPLLSDVLAHSASPAYHEVLLQSSSPTAAFTPVRMRSQVGTIQRAVRVPETVSTAPAHEGAKRRSLWWPLLGGMAAGIVLSLATWWGFVQHPEHLTQEFPQFMQQMLLATLSSTQRTVRLLAETAHVSRQPQEASGPAQTTPSLQTAAAPTAPPSASRSETGPEQPTVSRSIPATAGNLEAPTPNVGPQGTLFTSPTSSPPVSVRPPVPQPAPRVIVVQAGDTLGEIILRTYNRLDNQLLTMVQESNPDITNPSRIEVGQRIVLPVLQ
jgi:type II secretory pathway predicted ATPase ExeA